MCGWTYTGTASTIGTGIRVVGAWFVALGQVLLMPWRGRLMWPFAVAVLGFRYFRMHVSFILGHPLRNPCRTALRSEEILGLHRDWCENLTALARVRTKCVNAVTLTPGCVSFCPLGGCGERSIQGPGSGDVSVVTASNVGEVHILPDGSGSVHKSVDGSLCPVKITLLLKITSHSSLSNTTLHPALHRGRIPISDAAFNDGRICPVSIVGRPGILMSQTCVDTSCLPSGKLIGSGFFAMRLLSTSALSMMKMEVAPVLAMAWFVAIVIAFKYCGMGLPNNIRAAMAIVGCAFLATRQVVETFDVATVTSLSWVLTGGDVWVGSRGVVYVEIKIFHFSC